MRTVLIVLLLSTLPGCALFTDPPGVGKKAEASYEACRPVIAALERYKADRGAFPEKLEALVPKYLKELPGEVNGFPLGYAREKEQGFVLAFRYTPPGMNECEYRPASKWECSGWY